MPFPVDTELQHAQETIQKQCKQISELQEQLRISRKLRDNQFGVIDHLRRENVRLLEWVEENLI